ncbi:hypothetical protein G9C98_003014 [Cotesia typhae]|uniref:Uncharacterized protein n=1 Tax=Cotesia typhae TaxID=2053667 RepID=A0A8J5R1K9_9HYME|nr:hypothetical protein G9C98_003014 [Cotesia typhae]
MNGNLSDWSLFRFILVFRGCKMSQVRTSRPTGPPISQSKRPIIIYPPVSPESIIVPIVSCILGFPLLALLVICCLRKRAKMARERARRRNCDLDHGALNLVRFSPIHRLVGVEKPLRAVSLKSERPIRTIPNLDLDTVLEERSDAEPTTSAVEISSPD